MIKKLKDMPTEVWHLCVVTLISRSGTMALVFLPLYLSLLGINETHAGLVISVYGLGALLGAPIAGYLSDRVGAYSIMKFGLLLQGLILLVFPIICDFKSVWFITLAWALTAEAFRPASSAFLGSFADERLRRTAFAMNRVAVNLGMAIGPALGGVLVSAKPTHIFIVNGGASILAGTFLAYSFRRASFMRSPANDTQVVPAPQSMFSMRRFLLFLIVLIPAFVVFYQYRSTMSQYFLGRQILEPHLFGLLFPINALLVIALHVPLTICLQRLSLRVCVSFGAFLIGLGFGCFAFATTFLSAALCVVVWTLGEMALLSGSELYVSRIAGNKPGRLMGLYHMAINCAALIGPGLGPILLGHSGAMLWGAMFMFGLLSAVVLLHVTDKTNPPEKDKIASLTFSSTTELTFARH